MVVFTLGVDIKMGNTTFHPIPLAVTGHTTNQDCILLAACKGKVPASKEQIFLHIRPCKILVVSKTYILPVYGNSADHINSLQRSPQSLLNMGDAEKGDDFPQGQTVSWN